MNSRHKRLLIDLADTIPFVCAILVILYACFTYASTDVPPPTVVRVSILITDESGAEIKRPELVQDILEDIRVGRHLLLSCNYFANNYPESYLKTYYMEDFNVHVDFKQGPYCGLGFSKERLMVIFGLAAEDSDSCRGDSMQVVTHEMLHLVDMPKHKDYETREEFMFNDPVEQVMFWCVKPLEVLGK